MDVIVGVDVLVMVKAVEEVEVVKGIVVEDEFGTVEVTRVLGIDVEVVGAVGLAGVEVLDVLEMETDGGTVELVGILRETELEDVENDPIILGEEDAEDEEDTAP